MVYKIIKRTFDLILCVIALPVFLILVIVVGMAIKIEDGGPIFYLSSRIGKNSKPFNMIKFRSMKVNAENILNDDGSTYNAKDDLRLTRVGRFIREFSIDETSQILNVLKGDMSIIGPRASGWEAINSYQPDETDKMKVRPGITGYTQAYYRNGLSVREKRLKDAWYAENMTFKLDVIIFFKTFATVFKRENVYTNAEGTDKSDLWINDGEKISEVVTHEK